MLFANTLEKGHEIIRKNDIGIQKPEVRNGGKTYENTHHEVMFVSTTILSKLHNSLFLPKTIRKE